MSSSTQRTAQAHEARHVARRRSATRERARERNARIVAHLKIRFPELYTLIVARVDAGKDDYINALAAE